MTKATAPCAETAAGAAISAHDLFEADPALRPLAVLLTRAGGAVSRLVRRAVGAHGLTTTSLGVLGVLARADAVSHRELAARLDVAPATLTPVVDALDAAGCVRRERDPSDRRVLRLSITEQGRVRLAAALDDVTDLLAERLPRPAPDEEPVIRRYLLEVLAAAGAEVARL